MAFNNIQAQQQKVSRLLTLVNVPLDEDFVWEALQMAGSGVTQIRGRAIVRGQTGLAGLGRLAAQLVVGGNSYDAGLNRERVHTSIESLLSPTRLASLCESHGLVDCINRNPSHGVGDLPASTLSATTEAIIGAAYKTNRNDLEMVRRVMEILGIFP